MPAPFYRYCVRAKLLRYPCMYTIIGSTETGLSRHQTKSKRVFGAKPQISILSPSALRPARTQQARLRRQRIPSLSAAG